MVSISETFTTHHLASRLPTCGRKYRPPCRRPAVRGQPPPSTRQPLGLNSKEATLDVQSGFLLEDASHTVILNTVKQGLHELAILKNGCNLCRIQVWQKELLQGTCAVLLLRKRKVEVIPGNTPFLLSNSLPSSSVVDVGGRSSCSRGRMRDSIKQLYKYWRPLLSLNILGLHSRPME